MTVFFVSDLHLHESRPDASRCFLEFLQQAADEAATLYILGDLFESWIGDDDPDPHLRSITAGLRRATEAGLSCYFTQGNRDFLVGERFCADSGTQMMDESTVISIHGRRALLMHGDELCTDDVKYQRFRRMVRHHRRQALFLKLPAGMRQAIWNRVRHRSKASAMQKPESIMDVNQDAVANAMRQHKVDLLIHGHTHRPQVHELTIDGKTATRIVLGDWYEQGSVLTWSADGPELKAFEFGQQG